MSQNITAAFSKYSQVLDKRYDAQEKIYKLGRDLTRESKKLIMKLQRLPGLSADEKIEIIEGVEKELMRLRDTIIGNIARLIEEEPSFMFTSFFAGGMEEFVEALQFYSYLKNGNLMSYEQIVIFISSILLLESSKPINLFSEGKAPRDVNNSTDIVKEVNLPIKNEMNPIVANIQDETDKSDSRIPSSPPDLKINPSSDIKLKPNSSENFSDIKTNISGAHLISNKDATESRELRIVEFDSLSCQSDSVSHQSDFVSRRSDIQSQLLYPDCFIQGLGDTSGELMRLYINSIGIGDDKICNGILYILRQMKSGFDSLGSRTNKHMTNKINVHQKNLQKVENALFVKSLQINDRTGIISAKDFIFEQEFREKKNSPDFLDD